ncbi:HelD family protein [Isoptericola jiangsuensis]|uniref:HelD family protein n=1 Tax=Isoptericola jiangsuensis TaxID=548579 RepID=UPI003AAB847F
MPQHIPSVFDLVGDRAAKGDRRLVAADDTHLTAVSAHLVAATADVRERLAEARRRPGGRGQAAFDRDQEVHRLSGRLRLLDRFGVDLCLGRMVPADGSAPVYVGRLGLVDGHGSTLLVDWRSPAAEPFFAATHADPRGLSSRRRYRWQDRRVVDYWDEVLTLGDPTDGLVPDDDSAFVTSLATSRSERMRDVLGTLAADQDAIVRAGARDALVVDGGPGTGKTVVALHRAAYLLAVDPAVGGRHGGVLVVGPTEQYLAYVADVLPGLGEDGVRLATPTALVPEGAGAVPEADPRVAALKGDARMIDAVEPAVALHENPPTTTLAVSTPWADVTVTPGDWAEAFAAPDPGTPHDDARQEIWSALLDLLVDKVDLDGGAVPAADEEGWGREPGTWSDDDLDVVGREGDDLDGEGGPVGPDDDFDAYGTASADPTGDLRRALETSEELVGTFGRAWPLLDPRDVVGDLWTVPAYLRRCAPWLTPDEVDLLQRDEPQRWTVADLPILDAVRRRTGDPEAARRRRRRAAARTAARDRMDDVVEHLLATDDSDLGVMSMLRGQDLRSALDTEVDVPAAEVDELVGPFSHVVVDEAQELSDATWRTILARCPSGSLTIVGDRAQARLGFTETWEERLARVGVSRVRRSQLSISYRTPAEIMAEATPVIRAALPDANVPTSVRSTGTAVRHGAVADLAAVVTAWLAAHRTGTVCVVGAPAPVADPRVRSLPPARTKGLEFDLVVLVDPESFGDGVTGAVDRYVAMTRATAELVVLA